MLLYRNCRLAAYEIILRYRDYASVQPPACGLRCFLVAFGAAVVLYAKSLKIISFAEHVPMLRAKINEPDVKYDMEEGFFDDVLAGYSRLCNYRSMLQADAFWRAHRREAHAFAAQAGGDWVWLLDLIRHQRRAVRNRLLHVLWQRLHHDWRAFCQTLLSPFRQARHGLESLLSDRIGGRQVTGRPPGPLPAKCWRICGPLLQPGDVLLVRDDSRLTSAILPGFWTHAALFLGGTRRPGNPGPEGSSPCARHWQQIPENAGPLGMVIEAVAPRVQLTPLEKCLRVDHLVVLRPAFPPRKSPRPSGKPWAISANPTTSISISTTASRIVCTELVYRSYHNRGEHGLFPHQTAGTVHPHRRRHHRQALDGARESGETKRGSLQPVVLILKRRDSRAHAAPPERILPLLQRIRQGWRPARRAKTR